MHIATIGLGHSMGHPSHLWINGVRLVQVRVQPIKKTGGLRWKRLKLNWISGITA